MYELYEAYGVHFFFILLLSIVMSIMVIRRQLESFRGKIFFGILLSSLTMLVLEIFSLVFRGQDGQLYYSLVVFFNSVYRIVVFLIPMFWAIYIDYIIFESKSRLKKRFYYSHIVLLMLPLVLINLFYPIFFEINSSNEIILLPFHYSILFLNVLIYVHILVLILRHQHQVKRTTVKLIMAVLILPYIGAVIQTLFPNFLLIYPLVSTSAIATYLILETSIVNKDQMTGLYTRSNAFDVTDKYQRKNVMYSVVIIDINDFKDINDQYGHIEGDKVIIEFSNILKIVFDENALVCRFGGDEFLIVINDKSNNSIRQLLSQFAQFLKESKNDIVTQLKFSFGISHNNSQDFEGKIIDADNKMYEHKAKLKNYKRRKTD